MWVTPCAMHWTPTRSSGSVDDAATWMIEAPDAIVIGGGHNGLVCAAYLARAGIRPLVLERRTVLGGAVVTESPPRPTFLELMDAGTLPVGLAASIGRFTSRGGCVKINLVLDGPQFRALPGESERPQHTGAIELASSLRQLRMPSTRHALDGHRRHHMATSTSCRSATGRSPRTGCGSPMSWHNGCQPLGRMSQTTHRSPHSRSPSSMPIRSWRRTSGIGSSIARSSARISSNMSTEWSAGARSSATSPSTSCSICDPLLRRQTIELRCEVCICVSGSHPGGGVTGIPGHNAAREIVRDARRRSWRRDRRSRSS